MYSLAPLYHTEWRKQLPIPTVVRIKEASQLMDRTSPVSRACTILEQGTRLGRGSKLTCSQLLQWQPIAWPFPALSLCVLRQRHDRRLHLSQEVSIGVFYQRVRQSNSRLFFSAAAKWCASRDDCCTAYISFPVLLPK